MEIDISLCAFHVGKLHQHFPCGFPNVAPISIILTIFNKVLGVSVVVYDMLAHNLKLV